MLVLLPILLAWGAEPEAGTDPADLPLDAVVLLLQGSGTCAGAFIDDTGTVVTAYHCVASGGRPKVTNHAGDTAVGRVIATRASMDMALISVPDLASDAWLPLRDGNPLLGETVRAIGHPYGSNEPGGFVEGTLRWSVSEGIVSAVGPKAVQFTAPVNPGNSGGPVIDVDGNLVGVVSRRYGGDGLAFAGRAPAVADLVEADNGFTPLGGTLAVEALLQIWEGGGSAIAAGMRAEASFRDRLVFTVQFALPVNARWDVLRFDSDARWSELEARMGLRQRLFRGQWTSFVEVYGGGGSIRTLVPNDEYIYRAQTLVVPMGGATIGIGGTALDIALYPIDGAWAVRTQVTIAWPGTFWMF